MIKDNKMSEINNQKICNIKIYDKSVYFFYKIKIMKLYYLLLLLSLSFVLFHPKENLYHRIINAHNHAKKS